MFLRWSLEAKQCAEHERQEGAKGKIEKSGLGIVGRERQKQVGQQEGLHMRDQRSGRQAGFLQAPACNFAGQGCWSSRLVGIAMHCSIDVMD